MIAQVTFRAPFYLLCIYRAAAGYLRSARHRFAACAWIICAGLCLYGQGANAEQFGQLQGKVFGSGSSGLVIIAHGDVSSGKPANYHYDLARSIAAKNPGVTVVGILRPGYSDGKGLRSGGSNYNRQDQYTSENNRLLAQAINAAKTQYRPKRTVLVGHSGGAAQMAVIIGQNRDIADSVILYGCPCDIPAWRKARKGVNNWTRSQSPVDYVAKIGPKTHVLVVSGSNDSTTYPWLSQNYVKAAQKAKVSAVYISISAGHDFSPKTETVLAQYVTSELKR